MKSVGEKLRRARIEQGLDLATLANLTRITQRYLQAIETGDISELPNGFFYRSFVRQYASALGLDTDDIEADLERLRQSEAPVLTAAMEQAQFPIKAQDPIVSESNRRYLGTGRMWVYVALLIAMLIGCSAFYGWWRRLETASVANAQGIAQTAEAAPVPTESGTSPSGPESQPSPPSSQPAKATLPASNPSPAASRTTDGATLQPSVAVLPAGPKAPALSADDRVVVSLSATELTWVSVAADGKYVFSGLLRPNQSMTLGGKERTQLKIGNAGGLAVSWNGKAIGPVGPRGQVRTVLMTPGSYRIIAPDGSL
jgi:cytoskeleton protein RodZ